MSVSKLKDGSGWKVYIRYVDWQGKKQVHTKQTFETKRDALNYERDFIQKKSRDIQMNFAKFVEIYLEDIKPRIKLNTFMTKKHIIETKILPYFQNKSLAEIDSTDVIQWQNVLLCARDENGKAYAATYLRTVQNQLSAIFNHAHRFYGLPDNPSSKAGKMGKAIRQMIVDGDVMIPEDCKAVIRDGLKNFAKGIEAKLSELGFDLEMMSVVYAGGGAMVMKRYGIIRGNHVHYLEDIRANARGYEHLARQKCRL